MIRRAISAVKSFFAWLASDEPRDTPWFEEPEPESEDYLDPMPPADWVEFFKRAAQNKESHDVAG